jgi:hypothetical protein
MSTPPPAPREPKPAPAAGKSEPPAKPNAVRPPEIGGPAGPEPTRYGDWQIKGRCIDF